MTKSALILLCSYALLTFFACKPNDPLEDLARKISKSPNFIAMAKTTFKLKKETDSLKHLPQLKNLSPGEKNDSILKLFSSSSDIKATILTIADQNKKVDTEFPELKKLNKEEKQKVFTKAGALFIASQPMN